MLSAPDPPHSLDLVELCAGMERREKRLAALETDGVVIAEFGVHGNWFGSRWRRNRHFKWMVYAAVAVHGDWRDFAETLAVFADGDWHVVADTEPMVLAAETFVRDILTAQNRD